MRVPHRMPCPPADACSMRARDRAEASASLPCRARSLSDAHGASAAPESPSATAIGLCDDSKRRPGSRRPCARQAQRGEVDRQLRERAGIADELGLPRGDRDRASLSHTALLAAIATQPQRRTSSTGSCGERLRRLAAVSESRPRVRRWPAARARRAPGRADAGSGAAVGGPGRRGRCPAGRRPPRWRTDAGAPGGQVGPAREAAGRTARAVSPPSAATEAASLPFRRRTRPWPRSSRGSRALEARRALRPRAVASSAQRRVERAGLEARLRRGQRAPGLERRLGGQAPSPARGAPLRPRGRRGSALVLRSARGRRPRLRPGPAAASARCQARRSAASSGSLTSASASCTRRRSSSDAAR